METGKTQGVFTGMASVRAKFSALYFSVLPKCSTTSMCYFYHNNKKQQPNSVFLTTALLSSSLTMRICFEPLVLSVPN